MELKGVQRVPGSRDHVWAALNNPDVLKQCIPGCEAVEKHSDTDFTAKVLLAIGPVKARFGGKVQLTDLNPPHSCTIVGEGSGGAAGFGRGSAKVVLSEPEPGTTEIAYDADLQVGGKLAQVGARLIDSTAKKLTQEFFTRFATAVPPEAGAAAPAGEGATAAAEPAAPAAAPSPAASSSPSPAPAKGGTNYLLWGALAVIVIVLAVWLGGAK